MMSWTRCRSVLLLAVGCAFLAGAVAGCGPNEKDMKIKDLTAENEQLKNQIADRDRLLNDSTVREGDARSTIDELNREMAKLRSKGGADVEGWRSTPTFDMISIADSVLFDAGKATLTPTGRKRLAQISSDIRSRYGDRDVYVFGHTDAQPIKKSNWKDNWELGAQRSLTVTRTLRELGVPDNQLISASCGEYRPVVGDTAKKDQPRNRRVEVFAVRRAASTGEEAISRVPAEE